MVVPGFFRFLELLRREEIIPLIAYTLSIRKFIKNYKLIKIKPLIVTK